MAAFDPGVYKRILRERSALAFDVGGLMMRLYSYMMNIGTVTMLTLAGYSFLVAGIVSSVIAITIFLVSPRIGKLVDERGQSRVVPIAAVVTLAGLAAMLVMVEMHVDEWMLFIAAIPMGFLPNAQALVRSRWTYLLRTGRLGKDAPGIKAVFSYEGMIDDIAFMVSPSLSISIAAATVPIGGMLTGAVMFAAGVAILVSAKSTEPKVGWTAAGDEEADAKASLEEDVAEPPVGESAAPAKRAKSVIREYPIIRVIFTLMFLEGAFFGVFDTVTVAFAEEMGNPHLATAGFAGASVISTVVGLVFGMTKLRMTMPSQLMLFSSLIGVAYGSMLFISDIPMFLIVSYVAALAYAPFIITANGACERSVPGKRLTEAITWINAGTTCGLALGPTLAGAAVDAFGSLFGFRIGAIFGFGMPITVFLCRGMIKSLIKK